MHSKGYDLQQYPIRQCKRKHTDCANSSATLSALEKNNILNLLVDKPAIAGVTSKITAESNNLKSAADLKDPSDLPNGFIGDFGVDMRLNTEGLSVESGAATDGAIDLGTRYNQAINTVKRTGCGTLAHMSLEGNKGKKN